MNGGGEDERGGFRLVLWWAVEFLGKAAAYLERVMMALNDEIESSHLTSALSPTGGEGGQTRRAKVPQAFCSRADGEKQ